MGPDRLLRPLDRLVHRLDRLSGLRARRQRRGESRAVLRAGLEEVVSRLEGALDDKSVLVGTGPWDDPRPPDGSRGYLRR